MVSVFTLYGDLLEALGAECSAKGETMDLLMLQALYETPEPALQAVRDLISHYTRLNAALLTVDQVAERLRCEPKTVRQLAKSGALRGVKSRRNGWRFTAKSVDEFEQASA